MKRLRKSALVGVGASLALAAGGCAAETVPPAEQPQSIEERAWTDVAAEGYVLQKETGRVVLDAGNVCLWTPSSPQPQEDKRYLQVDARCLVGDGQAPEGSAPVYTTLQDEVDGRPAAFVATGEEVEAQCYTAGAPVGDRNGVISTIKVVIRTADDRAGMVAAAGLGYALGVNQTCSAAKLAEIAGDQA